MTDSRSKIKESLRRYRDKGEIDFKTIDFLEVAKKADSKPEKMCIAAAGIAASLKNDEYKNTDYMENEIEWRLRDIIEDTDLFEEYSIAYPLFIHFYIDGGPLFIKTTDDGLCIKTLNKEENLLMASKDYIGRITEYYIKTEELKNINNYIINSFDDFSILKGISNDGISFSYSKPKKWLLQDEFENRVNQDACYLSFIHSIEMVFKNSFEYKCIYDISLSDEEYDKDFYWTTSSSHMLESILNPDNRRLMLKRMQLFIKGGCLIFFNRYRDLNNDETVSARIRVTIYDEETKEKINVIRLMEEDMKENINYFHINGLDEIKKLLMVN